MCLDKPIRAKQGSLLGEKKGYKFFVKANERLYPFCMNRSVPFNYGWNEDKTDESIKYSDVFERYRSGYHFFRDRRAAIEQTKHVCKESQEEINNNMVAAATMITKTWGQVSISIVLHEVRGRDVVAYGRQYEGKRCYVARQLLIGKQIMHFPIYFLFPEENKSLTK